MGKIFKKLAGLDNKLKQREEELVEEYEDSEDEEDGYDNNASDNEEKGEWMEDEYEEGQLSIDVYQTPKAIVVKSTIAGVKPEDIGISLNNDMLTIRGKRNMKEVVRDEDYLYRECYWGSFSRSIILPVEVAAEKIEAELENGVLTVTLPKAKVTKQISIKVREK
jgi:HSP20 family protein